MFFDIRTYFKYQAQTGSCFTGHKNSRVFTVYRTEGRSGSGDKTLQAEDPTRYALKSGNESRQRTHHMTVCEHQICFLETSVDGRFTWENTVV